MGRTVSDSLLAAGYSFGAGAALRAADGQPRVTRLLLVAPPPSFLDDAALRSGEREAVAPAAELEAIAESAPRARFVRLAEASPKPINSSPPAWHSSRRRSRAASIRRATGPDPIPERRPG